jgi:hypothetical protein
MESIPVCANCAKSSDIGGFGSVAHEDWGGGVERKDWAWLQAAQYIKAEDGASIGLEHKLPLRDVVVCCGKATDCLSVWGYDEYNAWALSDRHN